jgi:alpha-L-rhamnosidase
MGDAQVFWRTGSYNADLAAFGEKWMADVRDGQTAVGCFPNFAPNFLGVLECGAPGWADAGVIIPWTAWRQYGDTGIITAQWAAMERYFAFIADSNPDFLWRHGKQVEFGDWLPAGSDRASGQTNTDLLATAYWAHDASLMAQMARAIGDAGAAARYADLSARVHDAFQRAYVRADGSVGAPFVNSDSVRTDATQTAAVLALAFGLAPDSLRAGVAARLVDDIAAHDGHLTTGFLGTAYVLPVLSDAGRDDVAFRLLFRESYPSWLYEVTHGATTMWERWNGDRGDPEMNSYDHYAFGAVGEWLYRYLAGIDQDSGSVGFKEIAIRPRWTSRLSHVRGEYDSQYGPIISEWRRTASGAIAVSVTIPANATARIYLPGRAPRAVTSGRYRFTLPPAPVAKSGAAP